MHRGILSNMLFTFISVSIISYVSLYYKNSPEHFKWVSFLYGAPVLYFYLIYILGNKDVIKVFTIHTILGVVTTLFIMCITLLLLNYLSVNKLVIMNLVTLILFISIYIRMLL